MSDRNSSRRASREALLKMLFQMEIQGDFSEKARKNFSEEFLGEKLDREYFDAVFEAYITHNDEIDDLIEKYSRGWKVERLAKVDLCALRICITEMLYLNDETVPEAAAINEAVRIVKIYGTEESQRFVNGILGKISREVKNADDR
ncbi:MAG: transcription antitermination factor NusB [Firmicutes bacterium]|nr:transcription antitermination factor NusB [Bacillota bacterium]